MRVSCRSVGNNLPPFATEMAVARQTFEGNRTTPTAIAKLSVGGLTVEHNKLVRTTKLDQAPHWSTQTCLLCNTKVCCTTTSGGSAIVNASLSLTEMDFKKKLRDPRYCAAFGVLVVRRNSSSNSPSGSATINDKMDPELFESLTKKVDTFVNQQELEAKRRVEVYYNEEQAKVRNMHRRLKRQMASLTEQVVKVLDAEKIQQEALRMSMHDDSPHSSIGSSSSPEYKNESSSSLPGSPHHKMPHVIYVQNSPKMDHKSSPRSTEKQKDSEQSTRDRFTAPLLTELNLDRDTMDSPPDGPQSREDDDSDSEGRSERGEEKKEEEGGEGGGGKNVGVSSFSSSEGRHRKTPSSGTSSESGGETFALTPPAIGSGSGSGSRNLRDEEAKRRLRGIRMKKDRSSSSSSSSSSPSSKQLMSTTAPARSDIGFAHFASQGVENLFEMDEDVEEETTTTTSALPLEGVGEEEEEGEEEEGEEEEEEGELLGDLMPPSNIARREINWNASYTSSGMTMSQSYQAPAASDWWGGPELTDSEEEEEEEEENNYGGEKRKEERTSSLSSETGRSVEQPSVDMFQPETTTQTSKKEDQFYGSSMPVAIPSFGKRR